MPQKYTFPIASKRGNSITDKIAGPMQWPMQCVTWASSPRHIVGCIPDNHGISFHQTLSLTVPRYLSRRSYSAVLKMNWNEKALSIPRGWKRHMKIVELEYAARGKRTISKGAAQEHVIFKENSASRL